MVYVNVHSGGCSPVKKWTLLSKCCLIHLCFTDDKEAKYVLYSQDCLANCLFFLSFLFLSISLAVSGYTPD